MTHPYNQYDHTGLWRGVSRAVADLQANGDLELTTAPEYVIGYLCEQVSTHEVKEAEEETYYRHRATLRIFGEDLPFAEITTRLGLEPTHAHRRGELRHPRHAAAYPHDMWSYTPPVPSERELDEHVLALHEAIRPHIEYLKALKSRWTVDVFCAYTSNSATAGFEVSHRALVLFTELEVPLGVSVVVA